ncbi:MAG: hypothetical protein ACLFT0_13415 [Spirulinaceae cyanobacterium]
MIPENQTEEFIEKKVTYTLEVNGKLFVIENVPARISLTTGEQLFSPQTVERIQQMILNQEPPTRVIETPVYEFS